MQQSKTNTNINTKAIPASMKSLKLKLVAAIALLVFLPAIPVIHLSIEPKYQQENKSTIPWIRWIQILNPFFLLWTLAALSTLGLGEWNLVHLFLDMREQARLRQTNNKYATENNAPNFSFISSDSALITVAIFGIFYGFESIYRTAIRDESEQRDRASVLARASFIICCIAIYSHAGGYQYDRSDTIIRPTKIRRSVWLLVFTVSGLAVASNLFIGSRI
jgi:hypothetical protein